MIINFVNFGTRSVIVLYLHGPEWSKQFNEICVASCNWNCHFKITSKLETPMLSTVYRFKYIFATWWFKMRFKRETMSSSIINLDVRFKIRSPQLSAFGLTEEDITAKTFRTHPTEKNQNKFNFLDYYCCWLISFVLFWGWV
jgi:hypothetical protein